MDSDEVTRRVLAEAVRFVSTLTATQMEDLEAGRASLTLGPARRWCTSCGAAMQGAYTWDASLCPDCVTPEALASVDGERRCAFPGDQEHDHEMCRDVTLERLHDGTKWCPCGHEGGCLTCGCVCDAADAAGNVCRCCGADDGAATAVARVTKAVNVLRAWPAADVESAARLLAARHDDLSDAERLEALRQFAVAIGDEDQGDEERAAGWPGAMPADYEPPGLIEAIEADEADESRRGWASREAAREAAGDLLRRAERVTDPDEAADLRAQAGELVAVRCEAAHHEDRSRCEGVADAVLITDAAGTTAAGCVRHGAVLLASLAGGKVHPGPGSTGGEAIEVYQRAQRLKPFEFGREPGA